MVHLLSLLTLYWLINNNKVYKKSVIQTWVLISGQPKPNIQPKKVLDIMSNIRLIEKVIFRKLCYFCCENMPTIEISNFELLFKHNMYI